MHFPKFWALGTYDGFQCWHWSDSSSEEAKMLAEAAATRISQAVSKKYRYDKRETYYGGERPLREEVIKEFPGVAGTPSAVITRNSYGCLVLNTAQMMFIDIDYDCHDPQGKKKQKLSSPGFFARVFLGKKKVGIEDLQNLHLEQAAKCVSANPRWGFRIYCTLGGLRLIATHDLYDPVSPDTNRIFELFSADPLYAKLCKSQKSFRARLTPKPWRIGFGVPFGRWPFLDQKVAAMHESWRDKYDRATKKFATCKFISAIGNSEVRSELAALIEVHDDMTKAQSGLPLG